MTITIHHKGKEQVFEAEFRSSAYTYSFVVEVNGHEVRYEPDEERNLRAIVQGIQPYSKEAELVTLIGTELTRMLE